DRLSALCFERGSYTPSPLLGTVISGGVARVLTEQARLHPRQGLTCVVTGWADATSVNVGIKVAPEDAALRGALWIPGCRGSEPSPVFLGEPPPTNARVVGERSEERRVGKDGRCRWGVDGD